MSTCGPSQQETIAQGSQQSLAMSMQSAFQDRFAKQSTLLNNLNASLTPVLNKGPEQTGFSPEELAARNTQAINTAAAANRNAQQAVGGQIAGRVDSSGLETGAQRAIKAGVSTSVANELAGTQNEITKENYDVGRSNYKTALAGSEALSGEYNPQSFGQEAQSGLQTSFQEADRINTQQQALNKALINGGLSLAKSAVGGFGNLDTSGSSSSGEQALNFFGGMG